MYVPSTTVVPQPVVPNVCPSCGRCRECGQPPVAPQPVRYTGPIWVVPLSPSEGAPMYSNMSGAVVGTITC